MKDLTINLEGLKKLRSRLTAAAAGKVDVGLFQDTAGRVADPGRIDNNPSLGQIHEFGLAFSIVSNKATVDIPERSFLRMPLTMHLGPELKRNEGLLVGTLANSSTARFLGTVGALGESVVDEAFATGGYGSWPALAPRTIAAKESSAILIESSQMRKAVGSRVVTP